MDRRFALILAVLVVGFGIFIGTHDSNSGSSKNSSSNLTQHIDNPGKKVTLLEYGDFQCPACERYFSTVEAVREKYKNTVSFQFRNFPLEAIHPNARASARAAEAADLQGKYWEMYSKLYTYQNLWVTSTDPLSIFSGFASQLGLNTDQFKKDFASSTVNDRINADLADAVGKKLESTPTFFLNDQKISPNPEPTVEAFSALIDKALAN